MALALGVASSTTLSSLSWVGQTFPGFLVLDNRVVASAGLAHWPATRSGEVYQHEVVSVGGAPLVDARDLPGLFSDSTPGDVVEIGLRRGDTERIWSASMQSFAWADHLLLHGTLLFCGIGLAGIALAVRFLRAGDRVADGTSLSLWVVGMYALTAVDLYGPYRFFRFHALLECLLFAAVIHNALVFPQPARILDRARWLIPAAYGASAILAIQMQIGLYDPDTYVLLHRVAVNGFALGLAVFLGRLVLACIRPVGFEALQRMKVVAIGAVAAIGPQVAIMYLSATTDGQVPENLMSVSGVFFPISLGYAVLSQDLFGVDRILRRTVNYALFTGLIGLAYGSALVAFGSVIHAGAGASTLPIALGVGSVLLLLPLRDRMQHFVNRLFFRSAYDFRRLVEETSEKLASVAALPVIARELERALVESLQPETIALDVRPQLDDSVVRVLSSGDPGPLDGKQIARAAAHDRPLDLPDDGLAVPFWADGRLVALLRLGRRMSGRYYGGDDRRLLQTLANQGAVAIENALALERLSDLNRSLEQKVAERTAELAHALEVLQSTQSQLIQREKMASLGQLVAGVAHEINNPVNFVQGNVYFIEEHAESLIRAVERLEAAARTPGEDTDSAIRKIREECELDHILDDLPRAFDSCRDGLERTTTIIRELRSFSRHDGPVHAQVDLHEILDSTINLLQSRMTGIELVRDYTDLPLVECIPGQIGQVVMNLLTNAADATGDGGRIEARTRKIDDQHVAIEIADDGCGIDEEQLARIFDPFFTTKEVGKGTGLGLSISYRIVDRHGGRIEVTSPPGAGTCFRVELPVENPNLVPGEGHRMVEGAES
ncbi:MAG: ATP-binding protein [Myxococcota bacterium]